MPYGFAPWLTDVLSNLSAPYVVLIALAVTVLRLLLMRRKVTLSPGMPPQASVSARTLADVLGVLLGCFVVFCLFVLPFFPKLFYIPSEAMEPTLLGHDPGHNLVTGIDHTDSVHDHIIVNQLTYRLGDPQHGDIIVFKAPKEADGEDRNLGQPQKENILTKRCMAIPGDTIWIHDGAVYRKQPGQKDFTKLVEPYLDPKLPLEDPQRSDAVFGVREAFTLPPDQYFVMGDNRNDSNDSRFWGTVARTRIIGKATAIYAPSDRRRALP